MPRRPRVVLPHIPLHLIQRGNNRQVCFVLGGVWYACQISNPLGSDR